MATDFELAILSNFAYINCDLKEGYTLGKISKGLSAKNYSDLLSYNNKKLYAQMGLIKGDPDELSSSEWVCSGAIQEEEARAVVNTVQDSEYLSGFEVYYTGGEDTGSRHITYHNPETKEMITVERGTGAQEWIPNGKVIQAEDPEYFQLEAVEFNRGLLEKMEADGIDPEGYSYQYTGHSNAGNKSEIMALSLLYDGEDWGLASLPYLEGKNISVRNVSFDGFHMSTAFWAKRPDLWKLYIDKCASGDFIRIVGKNDFVHGLGGMFQRLGEYLDNTVYIDKGNDLWDDLYDDVYTISPQQHFSTGFLTVKTEDGKDYYIGINGYDEATRTSGVSQGYVAVFVEHFSAAVVRREDSDEVKDAIIRGVMTMMTPVPDSIDDADRMEIGEMLSILFSEENRADTLGLLQACLRDTHAVSLIRDEEAEFYGTFGELFRNPEQVLKPIITGDINGMNSWQLANYFCTVIDNVLTGEMIPGLAGGAVKDLVSSYLEVNSVKDAFMLPSKLQGVAIISGIAIITVYQHALLYAIAHLVISLGSAVCTLKDKFETAFSEWWEAFYRSALETTIENAMLGCGLLAAAAPATDGGNTFHLAAMGGMIEGIYEKSGGRADFGQLAPYAVTALCVSPDPTAMVASLKSITEQLKNLFLNAIEGLKTFAENLLDSIVGGVEEFLGFEVGSGSSLAEEGFTYTVQPIPGVKVDADGTPMGGYLAEGHRIDFEARPGDDPRNTVGSHEYRAIDYQETTTGNPGAIAVEATQVSEFSAEEHTIGNFQRGIGKIDYEAQAYKLIDVGRAAPGSSSQGGGAAGKMCVDFEEIEKVVRHLTNCEDSLDRARRLAREARSALRSDLDRKKLKSSERREILEAMDAVDDLITLLDQKQETKWHKHWQDAAKQFEQEEQRQVDKVRKIRSVI